MHLGTKIKIARITKGFSQQELAEKINKTRPLISHIEQTGKVNHYTLQQICKALKININSIEDGDVIDLSNTFNNNNNQRMLTEKIESLQTEITTLKALVQSQQEIINLLKETKKNSKKV